jgi:hypothetical protein
MDGMALARLLRETWPNLKVVIASGHVAAEDGWSIADAVFRKPYLLHELVLCIETLLADVPA